MNCLQCDEVAQDNSKFCDMCQEQELNTFEAGVKYALGYLKSLYDGIDETDLWAEYMDEEAGN